MNNPVFCAIDTTDLQQAERLVLQLLGKVGGVKLGLEFFMAHGSVGYQKIARHGLPIFLDVKLHDIPNTVAGAIKALLPLQPDFITIHTSGGAAMLKAAVEAAQKTTGKRPKLLGVTVLTSLDADDLAAVGQEPDAAAQVLRLAKLAESCGLDGMICSAAEVVRLRSAIGSDMVLMVPGIRPEWAAAQDQKRVMTPLQAMQAGATNLVIGRPITGAENPAAAADRITTELAA